MGQQVLDRITSVSPEGYLEMMKEMADERKRRDSEIISSAEAGIRPTPMERSMGRLMRAPDHPPADPPAHPPVPPADPPAEPPNPADPPKPGEEPAKPLIGGEPKPVAEEFVPLTAADITIPEGLEVNETIRDEALAIVNNRKSSPREQLQAYFDLQGKFAEEASEGISKTSEDTQKTWQDEVKADPTIGGDKLPATLAAVNKLVTEYGDDKLVEAFALTGAGNNVHVIRFLNTVASKLTEGKAVTAAAPANRDGDAASRLFPSMKG